ncbi:MAG: hypothetical protein H6577_18830 [Lewinellaceae bacterium]|nr:hypothetical protein [Saprospiraceae bacterium]MCB9340181.1 hypothetical protein [Lewinellaceae bacterium]
MKKVLSTVLFSAVLFLYHLLGQNPGDFSAWIETQSMDGNHTVSCWCMNNTSQPVQLHYKAVLTLEGKQEIKEGSTLVLPKQPSLLMKGIFVIPAGEFDYISLEVTDGQNIVATASLTGPPKKDDTSNLEIASKPLLPKKLLSLEALEIEGLILDETRSKLAHDFYELFYNGWTDIEGAVGGNTVTIRELPNRIGIGSRISVEVDGEELSQLNLQPRQEVLESLATQLVEALKNYLENPQGGQEIEMDDLTGSGIY